MSDYETILYEQPAAGVARIVMNRPAARNAQNEGYKDFIIGAVEKTNS